METILSTVPTGIAAPFERPFVVGDAIGRSFRVWIGNFVPFSVVALAINTPVFLLAALEPAGPPTAPGALRFFVSSLANLVVTAALTNGVLEAMNGTRPTLPSLFENGLADVGSVALVSLGYGFLVLAGLVLLVVPGLVAMCALYVAIPAAVVEDIGPGAALGRSMALTKGNRWRILALALVIVAVAFVIGGVAGALGAVGRWMLPHPIAPLVRTAISVLATPLGACAAAVAYHDLRVAKEGVDTAALVKVFE